MKKTQRLTRCCLLLVVVAGNGIAPARALSSEDSLVLWYDRPAEQWVEALPIGNGRLGAMVYGDTQTERLQLNEDTLWFGQPHDYAHRGAHQHLSKIRQLLFAGEQREAEQLAMEQFMSVPLRQVPYQPLGELQLTLPGHEAAEDYRRELDLDRAVSTVRYKVAGVTYTREVFASYPDDVIVIRVASDQPGKVSFTATLDTQHSEKSVATAGPMQLALRGRVGHEQPRFDRFVDNPLHFEAHLQVSTEGGRSMIAAGRIEVTQADSATLRLASGTNYVDFQNVDGDPQKKCVQTLKLVKDKSFEQLLHTHVEDYQSLFRRVALDLGSPITADLPTDDRISAFSKQPDPQLVSLFFQFGRYLLIASSRPGSQPANLQGLWNASLSPSWESKYTTNINTEMNYWPAEPCNLAECHLPLFDALKEVAVSGTRTAQEHYDARGWVLHHNFDLWRGTAPINNSNHGIWPTGGAWLCQHLWWHYEFSCDKQFLAQTAYPLLKGASLFFVDFLIEDPRRDDSWLISGPSNSPEQGGLVLGPAMDHQIIRDLFTYTIRASEILGVDADLRATLVDLRSHIAPDQIGQHGQLQEWLEDKDNPNNHHRHLSHLYGVYPGDQISVRNTPQLATAAGKSLQFRGDGSVGWSRAWQVCLWARLAKAELAYDRLAKLIGLNCNPNLFNKCWDNRPEPFQIDGNFGGTAGIVEMLLQSHRDEVTLLPALPAAWTSGRVKGLRARGGFDVDMAWEQNRLTAVEIISNAGRPLNLRYDDRRIQIKTTAGQTYRFGPGREGGQGLEFRVQDFRATCE